MLYFDPMKPTHKQCNDCDNGYLYDGRLPIRACTTCKGEGEVEISEEEHRVDEECRREFGDE